MPKRGTNLGTRLDRLADVLADFPDPNLFDVVEAVAIDKARGRVPGLYKIGSRGSTGGVLVFDPAQGRPLVPRDRMAPHGILIASEGATWDTVR